ncbi:MAG: hypothetical protein EOP48_26070 [Sphingobacteriales bacterium]|nr:MAG: hypothetical protein EOP48_26070 [Sphingobacteriales bacterium]
MFEFKMNIATITRNSDPFVFRVRYFASPLGQPLTVPDTARKMLKNNQTWLITARPANSRVFD